MPKTAGSVLPLRALSKTLRKLYDFIKAAPNFINDFEAITTSDTTNAVDITVYRTSVTTGGVGKGLTVGNGAGAYVGQRKLITVDGFTATHTVVMDHANMLTAAGSAAAGCVLDALNEYVLLEWTGSKWKAIYSAAGVVS